MSATHSTNGSHRIVEPLATLGRHPHRDQPPRYETPAAIADCHPLYPVAAQSNTLPRFIALERFKEMISATVPRK